MSDDLKPCPFCRGRVVLRIVGGAVRGLFMPTCPSCRWTMPPRASPEGSPGWDGNALLRQPG